MSKVIKLPNNRRPIRGKFINDAPYNVYRQGEKPHWTCPFYMKWKNAIDRCSGTIAGKDTYLDCFVRDEWIYFTEFRKWAVEQGMREEISKLLHLDKDMLEMHNKGYGPDHCCFLPLEVNQLLLDSRKVRGALPLGVNSQDKGYSSNCMGQGKRIYLGYYQDPMTAHKCWQLEKANQIELRIEFYKDFTDSMKILCRQDVADALLNRAQILRDDAANGRETIKL